MASRTLDRWTVRDSAEEYGIQDWSAGYFDISSEGDVLVRPRGRGTDTTISLPEIIDGLRERGVDLPVLLRFGNILESRIAAINKSFRKAMKEAGYKGDYRGVYPVKVNQQQHVIEEVVTFGEPYHHGLEVGSKAELMAAIAYVTDPEALIVCNGYKDAEFIRLGLYAQTMGLRPCFVIEMPGELPLILECAEELGVEPWIGVRVKLASRAGGHWGESGGDLSFFGLTTSEIVGLVDELRQCNKLHCLKMLHYHLGSQIPNIRSIRHAVQEAARFYVGLAREGAAMGLLNVGGGLAVDYDGSHTNFPSSSNYSLNEYCADIVEVVTGTLDEAEVPHPTIVSESGRATVAYHSVLVFNILESCRFETPPDDSAPTEGCHDLVSNLRDVYRGISGKNVQEAYHDATFYRDEIRSLFLHGGISLRERGVADRIFWQIVTQIAKEMRSLRYVPDELQAVESALADIYYGNFSVFQSLPDMWAIDQLFPIMPIHRLTERPNRDATISDITCDSDGKIDRFIDLHDVKRTLRLHELVPGEEYCVGVFLIGAYQETLGDLHNLLGDPNVIGVQVDSDGQIDFTREISGDTVADVLSYVEYEDRDLVSRVRRTAERGVREGRLTAQQRRKIMEEYQAGLRGYTYFEQ